MIGSNGLEARFRSGANAWGGSSEAGREWIGSLSSRKTGVGQAGVESPDLTVQRKSVALARPMAASTIDAEMLRGAIVIDLRSPKEFAAGHVPGALNFAATPQALMEVPVDAKVILVAEEGCEFASTWLLAGLGYTRILGWLEGGMSAWRRMDRWAETA